MLPSPHNRAKIGQLAANFGTSAQWSWAGARGKEGLESPGCGVSHLEPYRVPGVSDCPRPFTASSVERALSMLVSAPAAGIPSCRRPSLRQGQGAKLRLEGVAAKP